MIAPSYHSGHTPEPFQLEFQVSISASEKADQDRCTHTMLATFKRLRTVASPIRDYDAAVDGRPASSRPVCPADVPRDDVPLSTSTTAAIVPSGHDNHETSAGAQVVSPGSFEWTDTEDDEMREVATVVAAPEAPPLRIDSGPLPGGPGATPSDSVPPPPPLRRGERIYDFDALDLDVDPDVRTEFVFLPLYLFYIYTHMSEICVCLIDIDF